ncbi:unnamed protein product [Ilex paraguariensis]|uniref:Uncharacterized protein n=1 Tax=Ilex paraguariensis TaxID=185542 RepID=A0ABC8UNP0_9AQUA
MCGPFWFPQFHWRMDAKALAKSKRAHSQHHTKKHIPHQASKAPSTRTIGAASPSAKQVRVKSDRSQCSSLLHSNWDRYEEEFNDSGSDNLSQDSLSKVKQLMLFFQRVKGQIILT